tara:strand:+ start:151 stop:1230 length:1080 start_codon:yes stop_codon:yes gene_type:complete
MPRKIFDGKRACRYCQERKSKTQFHDKSIFTCFECLGDLSIDEFKNQLRVKKNRQRETYRREQKNRLLASIGDAKEKRGYIYLLHSKSKGFYKVGVGVDPHKRLQDLRLTEYKIKDLRLLAFSVPVNDAFKTECFIHNKLNRYRVNYIKPCGGRAKELFSCDFNTISKLFIMCSQDVNWQDDSTRDIIDLSDKGILKDINHPKGEYKIRMKIHRSFRNYRKKISNEWNSFDCYKQRRLKCYGTGDRQDHLFESVFDKVGKCISLGIYESPFEAIDASEEFGEFLKSEKKSIRKAKARVVKNIYYQWLDHRPVGTDFAIKANSFLTYIGFFPTKGGGVFSESERYEDYRESGIHPYYRGY